MQQRRLIAMPDDRLETFGQALSKKYSSQMEEINQADKEKIRNAIQKTQFPHSIKDIQVYLNEETANLLADSLHPVLKEWGEKCRQFYTDTSLNKFIEPASGLVVAKRGGIYAHVQPTMCPQIFSGNGVWNIISHSWVPSPGSGDNKGGVCIGNFLNDVLHVGQLFYNSPIINPPKLSASPFKLLSPLHIAVLLDDVPLIKELISKGLRGDDDLNEWHLTPIEFAVMYERLNAFNYLLQNNATKNLEKAIKLAVVTSSFSFMEKLIGCVSLTQEAIEATRVRDNSLMLYSYLEARRKNDVLGTIETEGAVKALQFFLGKKIIPILSIADLICDYPEVVIEPLANDPDNNTIFHWAVTTGELKKVEALLEGFYQARLRKAGLNADVKKTNKQGKTVLDMALAQTNHEITAAILSHGHRAFTFTDIQKTQVVANANKIDLSGIAEQRTEKMQNIICGLYQRVDTIESVAANTLFTQIEMEKKLMQMEEEQKRTNQEMMEMKQILMFLCQHPNNAIPIPNNEVARQQPALPLANDRNRLFVIPQNNNAQRIEIMPQMNQVNGQ